MTAKSDIERKTGRDQLESETKNRHSEVSKGD